MNVEREILSQGTIDVFVYVSVVLAGKALTCRYLCFLFRGGDVPCEYVYVCVPLRRACERVVWCPSSVVFICSSSLFVWLVVYQ